MSQPRAGAKISQPAQYSGYTKDVFPVWFNPGIRKVAQDYERNSPESAAACPDDQPDQTNTPIAVAYEWPTSPNADNPLDPASYLQQAAAEFSAIQSAVHRDAKDYVPEDDPPFLADISDNEPPDDIDVASTALATASINAAHVAPSTVRAALSDVPLNEYPDLHRLRTAPSTKDTTKKK